MRLVFAGTPAAAVPSLDALLASRHDVLAVITRPDARSGRGRTLSPSPVAERASAAGIAVLKPRSVRDPGFRHDLAALRPDCCPVVAYGALVPPEVLAIPPYGWVNLHFSLLPAWRGAAPVQRAIIAGDEVTGASTFRLDAGLDTGPVYGVVTEAIAPSDTSGDLLRRLAVSGAGLLVATLDGIEDGTLTAQPQPVYGSTAAPKLGVDDARVDWSAPALAVDRLVRGATPAPGAWTVFHDDRVGVGPIRVAEGDPVLEPGTVRVEKQRVLVGTGSAPAELRDVRPAGRPSMPAADWARGVRLASGDRLG